MINMKKRGGILGLLVISILLVSIISFASFVSASWFEGIWNKITGGAVEENITTEPMPELASEPGIEENITCTDSDGGLNYNVKGYVSNAEQTLYDVCKEQTGANLVEGFCDGNELKEDYYLCPNGCSDGVCLNGECPTIIGWRIENNKCIADSGCDYDSSRYTYYDTEEICILKLKGVEPKPMPPEPVPEICSKLLIQGDIGNYKYYESRYESGPPEYSKDGKQIGTVKCCSARYKSSEEMANLIAYVCSYDSRKDVENSVKWLAREGRYELGEYVGQRVYWAGIEGNAKAVIWINANYILAVVGEGSTMPALIADAYLKKYVSDLGVPTVETEEEKPITKPVPCGIGECVPEEEVEEVEAIPEEKIFYKCNGCELEGKCYPMGYRKEGKYCSDNNEFIEQLGAGACDNHFECESNVCISGECISESLIRRVINWLKKIFGIEPKPPEVVTCSKLLIEKNIGDYEYIQTEYGKRKEQQAPVYSKDGTYTDTIKCCMAHYINKEKDEEKAALVCPYDNRQDVENSLYWLPIKEEKFDLIEYKKHKVYGDVNKVIIWTNNKYLIACGGDPKIGTPLAEDLADAYLKKYPNDLGEIEIPEVPPQPKSPKECGEIIDVDKRYECYTSLAVKNRDVSVCEKITIRDEHYRQTDIYIRDKCYRDVAIETSDVNICREISGDDVDTKDSCYIEVALKIKDSSLCEKTIQKNLCYAIVTNDPSICEKIITSKEKDTCYYLVALETNDISLCEKMNATFGKNECYEKIENCELAGGGERNVCYLNLARETKNASFCEKIIDSQALKKVTCYVEVAVATDDINLCERVTDIIDKDYCYKGVARETKDDTICEKIINSSIKDDCYIIVA